MLIYLYNKILIIGRDFMTYSLVFLMLLSLIILLYFTYKPYKNFRGIFKTTTSILFVAIAISGYLENKINFTYFIFIFFGLVFSLFGDVFLIFKNEDKNHINKYFIYGLLSFSLARIFFSIGFIHLSHFRFYTILFTFLLAFVALFILKSIKGLDFKDSFYYVAFYSVVISFMFIQSLNLYFSSNIYNPYILWVTIGALLFVLSDLILSFDYFYKDCPQFMAVLNLLVYYLAQLLIALSVLKASLK
jgi:uncharacterized membrane protein YhhN